MAEEIIESGVRRGFAGGFLRDFLQTTRAILAKPAFLGVYGAGGRKRFARAVLGRKGPALTFAQPGARDLDNAPLRGARATLPRRMFLARDVVLPSSDRAELAGMLRFEVGNLFPMAAEELIYDWYPRRLREDGYTVCRVLAVDRAAAAEALDGMGLGAASRLAVEPSTVSLANYWLASNGAWPAAPVMVIASSSDGADLAVVGPGGVECDRGVASEGGALSAERLASEACVLMSMYGQDGAAAAVERVMTIGCDTATASALRARTGLAVTPLEAPDAEDGEGESRADGAFAAGAAMGPFLADGLHVDFIEPERAARLKAGRTRYVAAVTAALLLLTVVLVWSALMVRGRRMEAFAEALEARAAEIAPKASAVDAKRQRLFAIQQALAGQGRVLDVLVGLYRLTPPDIYLTSVELDARGMLTMKGHAQHLFRPTEYTLVLEKDAVFGTVAREGPVSQALQRTEAGKTFISFTIVRDLKGTDKK